MRANTAHVTAAHHLNPLHTVPVLVDGKHVVIDSAAIAHYVDRKYPEPLAVRPRRGGRIPLRRADGVINLLNDLGVRDFRLHDR